MNVSLRPLIESDAYQSYKWRNNRDIWLYTGNRPTKYISPDVELEWIKSKLTCSNEVRYAICIGENLIYVGNVQPTNITKLDAEFHIFIGDVKMHNKGIGTEATRQILLIAKEDLKLKSVYLNVSPLNKMAIRSYEKCGFILKSSSLDNLTYHLNL